MPSVLRGESQNIGRYTVPRRVSMSRSRTVAIGCSCVLLGAALTALQQPAAPAAPAAQTGPTIELAPGLRPVPDYRAVNATPDAPQVPEGFTPLFNGRDLTGWHISSTA